MAFLGEYGGYDGFDDFGKRKKKKKKSFFRRAIKAVGKTALAVGTGGGSLIVAQAKRGKKIKRQRARSRAQASAAQIREQQRLAMQERLIQQKFGIPAQQSQQQRLPDVPTSVGPATGASVEDQFEEEVPIEEESFEEESPMEDGSEMPEESMEGFAARKRKMDDIIYQGMMRTSSGGLGNFKANAENMKYAVPKGGLNKRQFHMRSRKVMANKLMFMPDDSEKQSADFDKISTLDMPGFYERPVGFMNKGFGDRRLTLRDNRGNLKKKY